MRKRFVKGLLKILQIILTIIIAIPFVITFLVFVNEFGMWGTKALLLAIPPFLIFLYLSFFLHELGHVIAGRLAKIGISNVTIGTGREIARTNILGFPWVITSNPMGGYTFPSGIGGKFLRPRLLFLIVGGPLSHGFWILLGIGLHQVFPSAFIVHKGVDLLGIFILSNAAALFFSLVPMKASYQGMKVPSDMLRIFGLLFKSNETVESFQAAGLLHEASRYFDNKEYEQAAGLLKQCIERYPDQMIAKINLSVALIKAMRLQDAKELLTTLNEEKRDDQYDFLIYNNLAWVFLLQNNKETLGEADRFSKMAFDLNPDLPPIKGTRAYALISQGTVDEGINLLLKNVHLTEPTDSKANHPIWFCFLAYAYYLKGEKDKGGQYLQLIEDYQNWEPDEKYLYEVLKSKTEHFKGIFQEVGQLDKKGTPHF